MIAGQRTVEEIYEDVLSRLKGVEDHGSYAMAYCPAHPNTDTQALSVQKRPDGVSFKDHGQDCSTKRICAAIGIEPNDLFVDASGQDNVIHIRQTKEQRIERAKKNGYVGCTIPQYAEAKGLPADWLKEKFGLYELSNHPKTKAPAVAIPYLDESSQEVRVRLSHRPT